MNILKDQRGYTLVELIVAMSIFVVISVVVVGALVTVMQSSSKTSAERRVQQDARYSIEEIARQARSASIDYDFYQQNATDARCGFSPSGSNSTKALALVFSEASETSAPVTRRLVFFYDESDAAHPAVYRYQNNAASDTPTCAQVFAAPLDQASGPTRSKITENDVDVSGLTFYISPNQDPYDQSACTVAACNIARNTHPRTAIVMTTRTVTAGGGTTAQSKTGTTTLQTTIGSRAYPAKVLLGQAVTP